MVWRGGRRNWLRESHACQTFGLGAVFVEGLFLWCGEIILSMRRAGVAKLHCLGSTPYDR